MEPTCSLFDEIFCEVSRCKRSFLVVRYVIKILELKYATRTKGIKRLIASRHHSYTLYHISILLSHTTNGHDAMPGDTCRRVRCKFVQNCSIQFNKTEQILANEIYLFVR